jgi:DNA-binding response OmpR family regulator
MNFFLEKALVKILLISDNAPLNMLLQEELEDERYVVCILDDMYKKLDGLLISSVDLVIFGGMKFSCLIRDVKKINPLIPVIMYSAYDESYVLEHCSPDAYIAKSADPSELLDTVKKLINP